MNNEFIEAVETENIDNVKLLLTNHKVDPAVRNNGAIRWASADGHTEVVRLLLNDKRVDPSVNDNDAIRTASINGHTEVVKLLLNDSRVNPAANNNQAILWASQFGHTEVVKLLLTDPRVEWRYAPSNIKKELIKNTENQLKSELTTSYLTLERTSPQIKYDQTVKSGVPKEILKQTAYAGPYQELCMAVKNSEIPPVKLVALAKILKVEYDEKIEWSKLCDKVKHAIFVSLYLHN